MLSLSLVLLSDTIGLEEVGCQVRTPQRIGSGRLSPLPAGAATPISVFGEFRNSPFTPMLKRHQRFLHFGNCVREGEGQALTCCPPSLADHLQRHHPRHPLRGGGGLGPRGRCHRPGGQPAHL